MFDFVTSPKVRMINVRLTPTVHQAFRTACELRGASMSSLLHQFIVRTIREEKELSPEAFDLLKKPKKGILATEIQLGRTGRKRKVS